MMREKIEVVTQSDDQLQPGDRRQSPRVEVRLKVEFTESDQMLKVQGVVTDISRIGMRIRTTGSVRLRNPNDMSFWIYHPGGMIRVKGRVVRRPSIDELGIEFERPGQVSSERVDNVVKDTASRNLRFEAVVHHHDLPQQRSNSSLMASVHEVSRQSVSSFHDSFDTIKQERHSQSERWLSRRVATHL